MLRKDFARKTAISGIFAALATVIMCIGGMIPLATYVCPLLCMILGCFVFRLCGHRYGWTWYAAVSILSLLFGPDKEAAAVYVVLGNYPMIKSVFEKWKLSFLWKILYFNISMSLLYSALMFLLGLAELIVEFQTAGIVGLVTLLILGNITFVLTDRVLDKFLKRR